MFGSRGSRVRYCADAWARVSAAQTRARGAHRVAIGAHRVAVRVVATPPARASGCAGKDCVFVRGMLVLLVAFEAGGDGADMDRVFALVVRVLLFAYELGGECASVSLSIAPHRPSRTTNSMCALLPDSLALCAMLRDTHTLLSRAASITRTPRESASVARRVLLARTRWARARASRLASRAACTSCQLLLRVDTTTPGAGAAGRVPSSRE